MYHSVDAGVNYLLELVLLTATVPGGTEKELDINSFCSWGCGDRAYRKVVVTTSGIV